MNLPEHVSVVEVGPRDGFQMESTFIPTDLKIQSIDRLSASGLRDIEAVSFVHPRVIPQMRDARDVMAGITRFPGVRYWALVPNLKGAELALASDVLGVHFVICATETYNQKNVGLSTAESLEQLRQIVQLCEGSVPVAATLAATFGCPFEGRVPDDVLLDHAKRLVNTGIDQLGIADSAGLGDPALVRRIVRRIRTRWPDLSLRLHLHDTRGLGMANAWVGLEEGIDRFDTSFGGLGGCPVMEGASGNLATEDFLNLCCETGIETDVDLDVVVDLSRTLQAFLGRELESRLLRSGTRAQLLSRNAATLP